MGSSNANINDDIRALIFDLDGTLLNTEQLTRDILKNFLVRYGKQPDEEKERKRLGMSGKQSAVAVVNDYDLPLTPEQFKEEIMPMYHGLWKKAKPLPGVNRLMRHLSKHGVPFALASNSVTKNIHAKISLHEGWTESFGAVLGSDQVNSGKPAPDIFLEAANRINVDPAHCLVIEDSVIGVKAGKAAGMKVVAVPSLQVENHLYSFSDSILHSLLDFQPGVWNLPHFEDWIDDTLPIEPIHVSGHYCNGLFLECEDDGWSDFPDQIWGIYIGWAKVVGGQKVYKSVMSIGWDLDCCTPKRKIEACIVGSTEGGALDCKMQLLLVGFIRRSCNMGYNNMLKNLEILEEDKLGASVSLDLPVFSCDSFAAVNGKL